jgi:8-oxo-dGTP diphosphatase
MSLAKTPQGDSLLAFGRGRVPEAELALPLPLALVVAQFEGKTVFIYNRYRAVWELPGGKINAGEKPSDAAVRELAEETGQRVPAVEYVGWMKFQLQPDQRLELGLLYRCRLEQVEPFTANDEASDFMLWDLRSQVNGPVNRIDHYLARSIARK